MSPITSLPSDNASDPSGESQSIFLSQIFCINILHLTVNGFKTTTILSTLNNVNAFHVLSQNFYLSKATLVLRTSACHPLHPIVDSCGPVVQKKVKNFL